MDKDQELWRKFIKRTEENENKKVITCHEHKTGLQGAADLVVTKDTDDFLEFYLKNVHQQMMKQITCFSSLAMGEDTHKCIGN